MYSTLPPVIKKTKKKILLVSPYNVEAGIFLSNKALLKWLDTNRSRVFTRFAVRMRLLISFQLRSSNVKNPNRARPFRFEIVEKFSVKFKPPFFIAMKQTGTAFADPSFTMDTRRGGSDSRDCTNWFWTLALYNKRKKETKVRGPCRI